MGQWELGGVGDYNGGEGEEVGGEGWCGASCVRGLVGGVVD